MYIYIYIHTVYIYIYQTFTHVLLQILQSDWLYTTRYLFVDQYRYLYENKCCAEYLLRLNIKVTSYSQPSHVTRTIYR